MRDPSGYRGLTQEVRSGTFFDNRPGQVPNADFLHDLGSPNGVNWHTRMPAGSQASRDLQRFVTEPASLQLEFDGRESLHLGRPSVRIPMVKHGGETRWRLGTLGGTGAVRD